MVVAWRVVYVTYLGRACPDMTCEAVFEPSEWKSVYAVLNREIPDRGCPKLQDVVRAIATLGGFIDRPGNEPGTQTLWTGLQRCYDLSNGWNAFGPGAKKFSKRGLVWNNEMSGGVGRAVRDGRPYPIYPSV